MIHAIYPGSFDPITNGHMDIIRRAKRLFDILTVAVVQNPNKQHLFSVQDRKKMIVSACESEGINVKVDSFEGLLVNYAESIRARVIIRGLRAVSDFEFEFQLSLMNRKLDPKIQTVYFMSGAEVTYLSSGLIKEIASLGGDVHDLVPDSVCQLLKSKFSRA